MDNITKNKNIKTATVFSFVAAILLVIPWIITGKGIFFVYGDYITQGFTFGESINRAIKTLSFSWDWTSDLGGSALGTALGYMTYNPLFLFTLLFPSKFFPYLSGPMIIGLLTFAGFSSSLFMSRYIKNKNALILGTVLYTFSGFTAQFFIFPMLFPGIAYGPLLIWAIDEYIENKRRLVVFLAMFLCVSLWYSQCFGICVYCIIYFFCKVKFKFTFEYFKDLFVLIFEGLLGVLVWAVLLFPQIYIATTIPRVSEFSINLHQLWTYMHYPLVYIMIFCGFFMPPELSATNRSILPEVSYANIALYLPMVGMSFVIAYLLNKKNYKNHLSKFAIVLMVFIMIPILSVTFSAFRGDFSGRCFYMFELILALLSAKCIDDFTQDNDAKKIKIGAFCGLYVVPIVLILNVAYRFVFKENIIINKTLFLVYSAVEIVGILTVLFIFRKGNANIPKKLVVCCTIFALALCHGSLAFTMGGVESPSVMLESYINAEENIVIPDGEHRISSYNTFQNIAVQLNKKNASYFSSMITGSIYSFYDNLSENVSENTKHLEPDWKHLRSFLGVKYVIVGNENIKTKFNKETSDAIASQNDLELTEQTKYYDIYENKYALPFGFCFDKYISQDDWDKIDYENRPKSILKGVILNPEQEEKFSPFLDKVSSYDLTDFSEESFCSEYENLNSSAVSYFESKKDGFVANLEAKKDTLLVFSVPYDKGFRAYVNGNLTFIENVSGGMCAVPVSEGYNEIEFKYETPLLKEGIYVSAVSIIILLIYIVAVISKKHKKD